MSVTKAQSSNNGALLTILRARVRVSLLGAGESDNYSIRHNFLEKAWLQYRALIDGVDLISELCPTAGQ